MKACVVVADFYQDISDKLLASCKQELARANAEVMIIKTPGALEIPLALSLIAEQQSPDIMVALGCVIRGDTYHFEVVANTCAYGILQAQLTTNIPIGNGVLTVDNKAQAQARVNKGAAAAQAAIALLMLRRQ